MKIGFNVIAMADSEARKIINPAALAKIKQTDKKPTVRIYGIGEEGNSTPRVPELGNVNIRMVFSRNVIQRIADGLPLDAPVYRGHYTTTPDESGRVQVGTVIGVGTKVIGDKLNVLAAVYVAPEYRNEKLDVASIEAFTESIYDDKTKTAKVLDISDIRAIALGNSEIDNPAFDSARLKAEIAAFNADTITKDKKMGLEDLTPGMVRQYVRQNGLTMADLFSRDEIVKDTVVSSIIADATAPITSKIRQLETEKQQVAAEYETKVQKYSGELAKTRVVSKLPEIAKQRQLTDKQVAFITVELGSAKFDADKLDEQLPQFVDGAVDKFNNLAKIMGVSDAAQPNNNGDDNSGTKPAIPPSGNSSANPELSAVPADMFALLTNKG